MARLDRYPELDTSQNENLYWSIHDRLFERMVAAVRSGDDALDRELQEIDGGFRKFLMPHVVYRNRKWFMEHEIAMANYTAKDYFSSQKANGKLLLLGVKAISHGPFELPCSMTGPIVGKGHRTSETIQEEQHVS